MKGKSINLYIHLGFPKTGSSLIQRELFKDLHNINMINIKWEYKKINDDFLAGTNNNNQFSKFVHSRLKPNKTNILSCEDFSGEFTTNLNSLRVANELRYLFPDAIIVICLRNHYSYLESVYKHCVRRGFCGSRKTFYQIYNTDKAKGFVFYPTATILNKLCYAKYIDQLFEMFTDVRIMSFNRLINKDSMISEIKKAFDVELKIDESTPIITNKGHNDISVIFQRFLNKFVRSVYNSDGFLNYSYTKYFFHGSRMITPNINWEKQSKWKNILGSDHKYIKKDEDKLFKKFKFKF